MVDKPSNLIDGRAIAEQIHGETKKRVADLAMMSP